MEKKLRSIRWTFLHLMPVYKGLNQWHSNKTSKKDPKKVNKVDERLYFEIFRKIHHLKQSISGVENIFYFTKPHVLIKRIHYLTLLKSIVHVKSQDTTHKKMTWLNLFAIISQHNIPKYKLKKSALKGLTHICSSRNIDKRPMTTNTKAMVYQNEIQITFRFAEFVKNSLNLLPIIWTE